MVIASLKHAHFAPRQKDILSEAVEQYRNTGHLEDFLASLEALEFSDQAKHEYVVLVESTRQL